MKGLNFLLRNSVMASVGVGGGGEFENKVS